MTRRRIVYALAGILAMNVAVMAGQYVEMQESQCDAETRGVALKQDGQWRLLQVGTDPDAEVRTHEDCAEAAGMSPTDTPSIWLRTRSLTCRWPRGGAAW